MGVFSGPEMPSSGIMMGYDMTNGKSFVGAPITNTLPSPAINGLPTYGNTWGTYNTNQYNNNAYFSIGTISSVSGNIVTTAAAHPLRSYDVVRPETSGGGVTAGTDYLVKKLSSTTFSLHPYNNSQDGSQGYINPVTGNHKVYDDFANDVRIAVSSSGFPTMWWGYPHLPNSALVKEIIPRGFDALVGRPATDCIRLHLNRTDATDGMAYSADAAVTAGNVWTVSFWARAVTPSAAGLTNNNFQVYNYGGANPASNPTMSWTLGPLGVWQKYSLTFTANNPLAISYWFSSAGGVKFDIANIQYELGSIANNFAPGTRTNTQAVLDWTGRNTITAVSLTYASNGTFSFDGSTSYLSMPYTQSSPNNFTVEAWIYSTEHSSDTNIGKIIAMPYSSFNGWLFSLNGTSSLLQLRHHNFNNSSTSYNIASSTGLSLNTWYHVAATDDGTTVRLYVNGSQVASGSSATSTTNSPMTLYVGAWPGAGSATFFKGQIPLLKIYTRALTANEIQQNFNAIRSRYGI
jgi:hypothetical protein